MPIVGFIIVCPSNARRRSESKATRGTVPVSHDSVVNERSLSCCAASIVIRRPIRGSSNLSAPGCNGIHDRSLGGRLAVAPVSFGRSVAARLTGSRVQTGDPEFDESFVILSEPASFASTFLDGDTRAGLLAMRSRNPHVRVDGDAVTMELEGTEMVHENLHAIVGLLSRD